MRAEELQIGKMLANVCRATQQSTNPEKRNAGSKWEKRIERAMAVKPKRKAVGV